MISADNESVRQEPVVESVSEFIARKNRQWDAERERASIRMKDIGRRGANTWVRDAWTLMPQHNHPEKVLSVERLRRAAVIGERAVLGGANEGDIEYRFGYFVVGRIGRAAGRWTWGQFTPLIPAPDLPRLLAQARDEGTIVEWPP